MKNELIMAVNQICAEKDLPRDVILGAIEEALLHAYRRNYANNSTDVKIQIDPTTGEFHVFSEKRVVQRVENPATEISLEEARKRDHKAELNSTIREEVNPAGFGRIAAQTAKQVILQRIHEAERDALYKHFHEREGELVTGTVQAIDYRTNQVTVTLIKKTEGILAPEDQLPNDRYRIGQSVRCLIVEVTKGTRGPQIRLSRTHRNMLRRLLEREIPEIYNGTVEIKSIAREPGQRSKVAVASSQPGVDPVGSCVGLRGTRIQNIVDELMGEKIDVVEWSSDPRQFISNALSPARPSDTILLEDGDVRTAIVIVPDKQLSLAIGKEGQNARLAAKLTGWRIDIKSESEAAAEGIAEIKRQQLQAMKQRALESRVASLPPGDDLLSRAEWLLREKDKSAITLDQVARMLAGAEAAEGPAAAPAEKPKAEAEPVAAPAEPEAVAAQPEAKAVEAAPAVAEPEIAAPETAETEYLPEPELIEDLEEEDEGGKKPEKRGKKASKKRELVFDEMLGRVVARRKRKPGRGGWEDYEEY